MLLGAKRNAHNSSRKTARAEPNGTINSNAIETRLVRSTASVIFVLFYLKVHLGVSEKYISWGFVQSYVSNKALSSAVQVER